MSGDHFVGSFSVGPTPLLDRTNFSNSFHSVPQPGGYPSAISITTMPSAQMSTGFSYASREIISGALRVS